MHEEASVGGWCTQSGRKSLNRCTPFMYVSLCDCNTWNPSEYRIAGHVKNNEENSQLKGKVPQSDTQ